MSGLSPPGPKQEQRGTFVVEFTKTRDLTFVNPPFFQPRIYF